MRADAAISVFLNTPYDDDYEPLFLALVVSLIALGRVPHCVLEIPETGQGRLARIYNLLASCPVSFHDLSHVEPPPRFNMPFELGMAWTLARKKHKPKHAFIILEAKKHRLNKTCSDLNGIDPKTHNNSPNAMISCVLDALGRPSGNPKASDVRKVFRKVRSMVVELKKENGRKNVFNRTMFQQLVFVTTSACIDAKILRKK